MYEIMAQDIITCHCSHYVQTKVVLNPLNPADPGVMNDADLAGPLVFCLLFGGMLLLVS